MDMENSENCSDNDKKENIDDLGAFQRTLLKDENLDNIEEPDIKENPLHD